MLQKIYLGLMFIVLSPICLAESPLKLWYDKPAEYWEEALPLGNGRIGAMVYGNPEHEIIQLNEDTFWAGGPHNNVNPAARSALPKIRQLLDQGKHAEASDLAEKTITSQGAQGMPYQSAGKLRLLFPNHENVRDYYRELDLARAVTRVRYTLGKVKFTREVFASFTDQVIVVRLTASEPSTLAFSLNLEHPENFPVAVKGNTLTMQGISRSHEGVEGKVKLANLVRIAYTDGNVNTQKQRVNVSGATQATVLISMATNFVDFNDVSANARSRAGQYLENAVSLFQSEKAYLSRRQAHIKHYQAYFNRVTLNLGLSEAGLQPTDQRVREFTRQYDPSLVALYFQYGRYLLISSSQPGTQPANLQGIWNSHSTPPWDSKYTLNINAQMNYWPAEVTNLSELHEPFVQLIRDLAVTGQKSAQVMYGARGWMAHHNTDIWRISGAIDWSWGSWPMANAWLVQHLWQKYVYGGDVDYLRSVFPILQAACHFFEDFLIADARSGWLFVSPSMSPENEPLVTGKKISASATMDTQLLFDLFSHSVVAGKLLNHDAPEILRWESIIARLPPLQIGQYHQLQEWHYDWDDPMDNHRHISHLYALHPSNQISPWRTPELFNAAKVSMEQRGDPSTGWSMNWKINVWARLLDGDRAYKLIKDQITPVDPAAKNSEEGGTYPNLMDAHPPFQIDGNFGFTAGVAEMLAQSHDQAVHLLPALPQRWPSGYVTGLVMRGGFVVDMKWDRGIVRYLKIHSRLGGNLRLRAYAPLPKSQGFNTTKAKGYNPNPFYFVPTLKPPIKHTAKKLPRLSPDTLIEVDIATQNGKDYIWGSLY